MALLAGDKEITWIRDMLQLFN